MHKAVSQIPNSTSIDKSSNRRKAQRTHKIKYTYNKTGNERTYKTLRRDRVNTVAA